MAIAREHSAVEREHTMESKLKGIETQMESFRQAKSQLVAALEMEKAKAEGVQEELDRYKMCFTNVMLYLQHHVVLYLHYYTSSLLQSRATSTAKIYLGAHSGGGTKHKIAAKHPDHQKQQLRKQ